MNKSAEKQRRWRKRRQAEGLLTVTVLVPDHTKDQLRDYAAQLRGGATPLPEADTLTQLREELAAVTRSREWWKRKVRDKELREGLGKMEAENQQFEEQLQAESPDRHKKYTQDREAQRQTFSALFGVGVREPIELEVWRWLMQQAHPDRNPGNPKAVAATAWLSKAKPVDPV